MLDPFLIGCFSQSHHNIFLLCGINLFQPLPKRTMLSSLSTLVLLILDTCGGTETSNYAPIEKRKTQ